MNITESRASAFYQLLLYALKSPTHKGWDDELFKQFRESKRHIHLTEEVVHEVLRTRDVPNRDTIHVQILETVCVGLIRSLAYKWNHPAVKELFEEWLEYTSFDKNHFMIIHVNESSSKTQPHALTLSVPRHSDVPVLLRHLCPELDFSHEKQIVVMIPPID